MPVLLLPLEVADDDDDDDDDDDGQSGLCVCQSLVLATSLLCVDCIVTPSPR